MSVLWMGLSWVMLSCFETTVPGKMVREVNTPLAGAAEDLFYGLAGLGLFNKHSLFCYYSVVFVVYAAAGFTAGVVVYFINILLKQASGVASSREK